MLPLRQRAACMARQTRLRPAVPASARTARFASTESHGDHHHDAHGEAHASADEPFGSAFFVAAGAIPAAWLLYTVSRPGKDGEPTALETYLNKFSYLGEMWQTRNSLHTAAVEQAAHDKNLLYTVDRNTNVDLRFPEIFQTGSPYNVPAGHSANLDHVVAHYQEQYQKETARQAAAAAAAASQAKKE